MSSNQRESANEVHDYSIGYWQGFDEGHVSVRIEANRCRELKEYQLQRALGASVEDLVREFGAFSFLPFAPVRQQVLSLGRAINRARKLAGLECVPLTCIRLTGGSFQRRMRNRGG